MEDAPWFRHYEEGVPRTIPFPETTLPAALDQTAERYPDRVALRFYLDARLPVPAITYRQLQDATLRFATALFQLGVRKGDRVALMLPNCPQFVIAFYGAMRIGAIPVNTNPMYVSREMREQFEDSGCETVVLLDQFYPRLREIHAATRVRRVIVADVAESLPWYARPLVHLAQRRKGEQVKVPAETDTYWFRDLVRRYPPTPPGADLKPSDVALLQYTGGTTGTPKAAMLTHRNLVSNSLQAKAWFPSAAGDLPGGDPLLPRLRPHLGAPVRDRASGRDRRDPPPAAGGHRPRGDPALPRHPLPRRPHALRRDQRAPPGGGVRPAERRPLRERGGSPAAGGVRALRGPHRRAPRRRLRPDRDLPPHPLHADLRRAAAGEHRAPLPGHGRAGRGHDDRRAGGVGRGGRARGARPPGDARLLGATRGDGGGVSRRLAPHRRHRPHGRGGLLLRGGPPEGHDRRLRLQGPPARGGGGAPHAPEGARGGGGGGTRPLPWRERSRRSWS